MAKTPSTNVVLLILGDSVVGRFEPTPVEKEDGSVVTRQAMTQAKAVLQSAAADTEHELHDAVMSGELELVNSKLEAVSFGTKPALQIG